MNAPYIPPARLNIAMLGTRGVPAAYGGFETAVEEIGARLVAAGHEVTVYCRNADSTIKQHRGMSLVHLPAVRMKVGETLSHTALSVAHLARGTHPDIAFVFNAANAPFVPWLRSLGIPTAVHVDGLEWKRAKWQGMGRRYYRLVEKLAVQWADALIADAQGIADYYDRTFGAPTELLTYGTRVLEDLPSDRIEGLGLSSKHYHLVVARFEPENHVDVIVDAYHRSNARRPLVVVGSAPYSAAYTQRIRAVADSDSRIRLLGGVYDQVQLDQLYAHALTYVHGHSVGGTNPSLLRAMGGGTSVLAYDIEFNREVLGDEAGFFNSALALSHQFDAVESEPERHLALGRRLQRRAQNLYDWDAVSRGYEDLGLRLASGYTIRAASPLRTPRPAHSIPRLP
ncbi:DUF1972 domain-containing protein [Salinibacterium sp. SYSU T00001]|uniref:DUF1972 domain-containing protein n=1 Tax=Homoserinimonas sedimenticola TaxID=2986805 RepID=UPI0022365135|nr:DUF1972 domain-containing protein [Salinibacterium sedimenticola]MCW4385441.1 DUF1972 domain-containing protein [Salinibacterium sedimenticola]